MGEGIFRYPLFYIYSIDNSEKMFYNIYVKKIIGERLWKIYL